MDEGAPVLIETARASWLAAFAGRTPPTRFLPTQPTNTPESRRETEMYPICLRNDPVSTEGGRKVAEPHIVEVGYSVAMRQRRVRRSSATRGRTGTCLQRNADSGGWRGSVGVDTRQGRSTGASEGAGIAAWRTGVRCRNISDPCLGKAADVLCGFTKFAPVQIAIGGQAPARRLNSELQESAAVLEQVRACVSAQGAHRLAASGGQLCPSEHRQRKNALVGLTY